MAHWKQTDCIRRFKMLKTNYNAMGTESNIFNDDFYTNVYAHEAMKYYGMHRKRIEKAISMFGDVRNGRLLDIGCGDGHITRLLTDRLSAEPFGLDISAHAIEKARKTGMDARRFDVGGGVFPFDGDFFDATFCGEVLEHVYDTEALLKSIIDTLKPGGRFCPYRPQYCLVVQQGVPSHGIASRMDRIRL